MAFLSTNRYRDSWAYRSQNGGFNKRPARLDGENTNGLIGGLEGSATTDNLLTLNKTMSQLQFGSRPQTPNNNRNIRPSSAGATRLNQNPNHRRTNARNYSDKHNNTENFASNTQSLRIDPSNVTLNAKASAASHTPLSKVPRYVETDKQVLRFYCHFFEKETQITHHPDLMKVRYPSTARLFTLLIYLNDFTIEIAEEKQVNSGQRGGQFFKRNYLKKDDQTEIAVQDLVIGGTLPILGHDFFITDCDTFTRNYFRRNYDIILGEAEKRPEVRNPEIGAQNSTGLGLSRQQLGASATLRKTCVGARSQDFSDKREQVDKTTRFLKYNGVVLSFKCVELLQDNHTGGMTDALQGMGKQYCLTYYVCDDQIEVRMIRSNRSAADDPSLLLKKCRMPINWRDQGDKRKVMRYYQPEDLITGNVIDCFGRHMLLLNCDKSTRQYYQQNYGITQNEVILEDPEEVTYENSIPQLGDGYLAIGGEADTLHTVYGHPKPAKDWQKANRNMGQIIRCRLKMITDNYVDKDRVFNLTFHLEDDSIAIFEERSKNSGCVEGQFLKRGVYINGLPPDCEKPRNFVPQDIYLGNVILVNGYEMQITEMDDLSVKFCEDNSDEFPFFDTYEIIHKLMGQVLDLGLDLRQFIVEHYDPHNVGFLPREDFVKCLDALQLTQEMNDQELMTLMRRFKGVLEGNMQSRRVNREKDKYYFHEMCDLFSHATYVKQAGQRGQEQKSHLERLLEDFRARQTQWRRLFRTDHHSNDAYITASIFVSLTKKAGMKLSKPSVKVIIENFALDSKESERVRATLPKDNEMDEFDMANAKISESAEALSRSKARSSFEWIQERRKQHGQSILRKSHEKKKEKMEEYVLEDIVINFNDLCDAIYLCDWVD